MTFEEVKKFLEDNKDSADVQSLFTGYVPKETLADFAETEEGKKLLQPKLDKYFTKGLDTWKANNLSKIVEDEVAKRNPAETAEQKMIREMQEQINSMQNQNKMEKLKTKTLKALTEKKLPVGLADYLNISDEEHVDTIIASIEAEYTKSLKSAVEDKLKDSTPSGQGTGGAGKSMTKEELMALPTKDQVKFYNENKDEFNRILNS